jgi:hypothetical protein
METLGGHLPGNPYQRRPVHVRVGDAGQKIRCSGAKGRQANTRLAGEPALDVGHKRRALLVARLEKMDLGIKDCLKYGDVFFARHAEHVFQPFVLKTMDQELRCRHASSPFTKRRTRLSARPARARWRRLTQGCQCRQTS